MFKVLAALCALVLVSPAAVAKAPPDNQGMGFGGFILGLLLLGGVLGLVYLAMTGAFSDLFSFATGAPRPPAPWSP